MLGGEQEPDTDKRAVSFLLACKSLHLVPEKRTILYCTVSMDGSIPARASLVNMLTPSPCQLSRCQGQGESLTPDTQKRKRGIPHTREAAFLLLMVGGSW